MSVLRPFRVLYVQVLIAIALGILVGALWPETGVALKPLGDGFIKLIKMIIAPVIFCTVAGGIAHMSDLAKVGRVGATLTVVPDVPMVALAVLVGIDRFMSECRALTNLVGNGVATLVIAGWEGELDRERLARELKRGPALLHEPALAGAEPD